MFSIHSLFPSSLPLWYDCSEKVWFLSSLGRVYQENYSEISKNCWIFPFSLTYKSFYSNNSKKISTTITFHQEKEEMKQKILKLNKDFFSILLLSTESRVILCFFLQKKSKFREGLIDHYKTQNFTERKMIQRNKQNGFFYRQLKVLP